jgi:hypothetical protein
MDWQLSADLLSMDGKVEIRYINLESVPLETLYLRLYPNLSGGSMTMSETLINGESTQGQPQAMGGTYQFDLQEPLQPGESLTFTLDFRLDLPSEMSGNYGLFGSFDGLLVLQESYPIIPVYDQDGWDIDIPVSHGDLTHLDPSFYLVRVTFPANLETVATGIEVDQDEQDKWRSITFAAGPVRDFYFAAAESFEISSLEWGETVINSYALPQATDSAETALDITKFAFESFSQRLAEYPYTEFDLITTPMLALGMEYPGVIALNVNMLDEEAEISGLPGSYFLESTTAHEVAHQWFYNMVGNDQQEEPWLDEAIVQYLTGIYFLDRYGEQGYRAFRQSWIDRWDRIEQQPTPISLPASSYDGTAYGAIVYGRGPLFVEALAERMGEQRFWEFLRAYIEEYQWAIGQPEGFIRMAEETCDCALDDLWETWGIES